MLAIDLVGVGPECAGIISSHVEQIREGDFGADHCSIGNDVLQNKEKAVFSRGEKIIPDVIGILYLVLGFLIAESQEIDNSFNDVIDRVRGQPEGFED